MSSAISNIFKGKTGEDIACNYLKKAGFEIIERNFKTEIGEIDVICAGEGYLVFVEVKSRLDDKFGNAAEAVNADKQRKISQVAAQFIAKYRKYSHQMRFDVIEVYMRDKKLNHIRNAFDSYLRY